MTELKTHTHGDWTIEIVVEEIGPEDFRATARATAPPVKPNRDGKINTSSAETAEAAHDEALEWMKANLPD